MTTTPTAPTTRMTPGFGQGTPASRFTDSHLKDSKPQLRGATFDDALWQRLQRMDLDEPAVETPISKRLAAEHKWTASQTFSAIQEYKRFVYLTQRAGFEVTPSRPVDLVWHEHLMHTKNYWGTMCRDVLQNDLHHKPGTGGRVDEDRLQAQYQRTLDVYRDTFREEPPADIWPKPASRKPTMVSAVVAAMFAGGIAAGIANRVVPLIIVCVFGLTITLIARYGKPSNARAGCGSGCGSGGIGSSGASDSGGCGDGGGGCGGGD